jgi:nitroreductase
VSPEWDFVDMIPVGYPAETPKVPPRKPVTEVIEFLR